MLSQQTLLVTLAGFTLLTTVLLVSAALYSDALAEQKLWAWGNVASCVGLLIGGCTGCTVAVHGVLSYGFLGFGLAMVLKGLRVFCALDLSWRWIAGMVVISLALPGYYAMLDPSFSARLVVTGLFFGALNGACALTLFRHTPGRVSGVAVTGFSVLALSLFLRAGFLLFPFANPQERADEVANISLLVIQMAQVCIVFGLILMVTRRYSERLKYLSTRDHLTGSLNRSGFEIQGRRVMHRARQNLRSASVVMIDADHFKLINDRYGHPAGDEVLRHLADLLTAQLRPTDFLGRHGGEEFALVFDGLSRSDAMTVAQRLCRMVEGASVAVDAHTIKYTVSMGVACSDETGYELTDLMAAADRAMYLAKASGRNRVSTEQA